MHTINDIVVRGRSYKNYSTRKFIIQKFHNMKISISDSTVDGTMHSVLYCNR